MLWARIFIQGSLYTWAGLTLMLPNNMPQHDSDTASVRRLTVEDASRLLGLSENAIRKRVERGSIKSEKIEGTRYILLDGDMPRHDKDMSSDIPLLVARLENEIEWLRREVERKDTIIMSLSQSIAALEAPTEPREAHEKPDKDVPGTETSPEPKRRSWWHRFFGLE